MSNINIHLSNYIPKHDNSDTRWGRSYRTLTLGNLTIYFWWSYPVAFETDSGRIVSENYAKGSGMGMMLNYMEPDKKKRYNRETFENLLRIQVHKNLGTGTLD